VLDLLNRYSHGFVAVPVVRALDRRGVFGLLAERTRALSEIIALAGLNAGHAAAAFDLLQSLGWVQEEAGGLLRLLPGARPHAVPDDLLDAYACDWARLDGPALTMLERFTPCIRRRWDTDAELADQLSGALALPLANGPARLALAAGTAEGPLRAIFAALGWANEDGRPTPLGAFVAERGQVTGAAGSYAPLLHAMPMLLGGDPREVMRRDASGAERHLDRTANVIASGFQHGRYFADLEAVLAALFDAPDLAGQPAALVDMGCGDGTLLRRCWETALRSRRGSHLATHPLLLVGTDFNAAALEATGRTLAGLPHLLLEGDIADPARLVRDLAARGVDPQRVLHLRSFLDHDRPAVPPRADWSARATDGDRCIVVAPDGALVPPGAVMQSLVEHLGAWRAALGAHGLMMLEVHRLPPAIVAPRRDDTEAPHFDAYHAFSGQQLVPADSFVLAAAEVGLFGDPAAFRKYPRIHPFARIQLQHLKPQPWRVRAARPADLPALLALEEACWPEPALRHDAATLAARLARPRAVMVAEQDGVILAALHVQRIASVDVLRGARWGGLDALHREDGPVLQLLGLMVRPQAQDRGLGDALADFALQWAALTPGVEAVAGLTRCRDWDGSGDYAAWTMARGADGLPRDATLRFHIGRGARLVALVPGYRPEDTANAGHAVLIAYALQPGEAATPSAVPVAMNLPEQVADCVRAVMRAGADRFDASTALRDLGLDSADLLELRTLLNRRLGLRLEASFFFDHPSPARIAQALLAPAAAPRQPSVPLAATVIATPAAPSVSTITRVVAAPPPSDGAIAIIGLACRLPGAPDADAFWRLMEEGRDATGPVPPDRWAAAPGERGGFLDEVAAFDPAAFAISAREARSMDPQQRLLLEALLATMEHAGLEPDALRGSQAGVFLGLFAQDWERRLLAAGQAPDGHFATGTSNAIAAGRLAYAFGLTGPALAVNTACSSSLVAVHLAARSLRAGECRLAFAGGASLLLMPDLSRAFADAGMLAADGRCRPFDAAAAGYARAEGVGLVAMKRLADALADGDRVLAVLRGSAVNQDGASNGLTAPSGAAQRAVIAAALADAGLAPDDVDAVEAHGTGTPLGDPIEATALAEAYGGARAAPLLVTAAKGNIGHAEAAAGIAGLIKCVLALRAGRVPGIAHLAAPNPALRQVLQGALRLADGTQAWPGTSAHPRRMAVSAFGFSGTNVHAVLEQAPAQDFAATGPRVMPLAARDAAGLRRLAAAWAEGLDAAADPAALCAAASRRRMLPARAAVTGDSTQALRAALVALAAQTTPAGPQRTPRIGFLFTGQGSQHRGMGLALAAREPRFRAALDRADAVLRPLLGRGIDELLAAEDIGLTGNAQPAICAVQLALVDLLAGWGIRPAAVLGHSVGEIAAAHAAGILGFEDALRLAAMRGRIMQALPAGGAMVALRCDEAAAERLLDGLEASAGLAALNGPQASVVSGMQAAMEQVSARAAAAGILAMPLRVSHAFHSPLMDPALAPFAAAMDAVALHPPHLPVLSTLSGDGFADMTDPDYWVRQIRAPVRFAAALAGMPADLLVEIGPLPVLGGLARGCGAPPCEATLTADGDALASMLAALHGAGAALDWRAIHGGAHPGVDLPPSPLERRRFWVDLPPRGVLRVTAAPDGAQIVDMSANGARIADAPPDGAPDIDTAPAFGVAPGTGVLGRRIALPGAEEARFAARLTAGSAPFFQDHRLHGRVVVPAASHIAVALTALARLGRPTALADLVFPEPFALADDEARQAQCVLGAQAVRYVTAPRRCPGGCALGDPHGGAPRAGCRCHDAAGAARRPGAAIRRGLLRGLRRRRLHLRPGDARPGLGAIGRGHRRRQPGAGDGHRPADRPRAARRRLPGAGRVVRHRGAGARRCAVRAAWGRGDHPPCTAAGRLPRGGPAARGGRTRRRHAHRRSLAAGWRRACGAGGAPLPFPPRGARGAVAGSPRGAARAAASDRLARAERSRACGARRDPRVAGRPAGSGQRPGGGCRALGGTGLRGGRRAAGARRRGRGCGDNPRRGAGARCAGRGHAGGAARCRRAGRCGEGAAPARRAGARQRSGGRAAGPHGAASARSRAGGAPIRWRCCSRGATLPPSRGSMPRRHPSPR
jgi:acyl transferase domain-containing protein/acyl carrier protein